MDGAEGAEPPPSRPAATEAPGGSAASPSGGAAHAPFLRRLRLSGHDPAPFRGRRTKRVLLLGLVALAALALVPFLWPAWSFLTERLATLVALVFLIAAIGLWLGMGVRAFAVAAAIVLAIYGLTAWTTFAFDLADFFAVAVLVGFGVFALAGFNLVFVLEEVVFDLHRAMHLRSRLWAAVPSLVVAALAVGLPLWRQVAGGPSLPALWAASVLGLVALGGWWILHALNDLPSPERVLRELHLFVAGVLAAGGLAEAVGLLRRSTAFVPSLVGYLALLGTWVYVSYSSLQRAHFLLRRGNTLPWLALLLGASFAILAHAQVLFQARGAEALAELADERSLYLIAGVWTGIGFYLLRALAALLRGLLRPGGLRAGAVRTVADGSSRVAEGLLMTPEALEEAAFRLFRRMDELLPGQHRPPQRKGWEYDSQGGLRSLEEEE